jgi:3,5-dihydroxyphenylacetyl-CoA synthase
VRTSRLYASFIEAETGASREPQRKVSRDDFRNAKRPQQAPQVGVDVPVTISATLSPPEAAVATPSAAGRPRIVGVGTAVAGESYSQAELLDIFRITDPRLRSVFLNGAIERRYLSLPPETGDGTRAIETQEDLLGKHKALAVEMGTQAIAACLKDTGAAIDDIGHLCCVTSTGFLTPGLSALLIRQMGIAPACSRVDVVGMGCNGGLNALGVAAAWSTAHPGQLAILLCAEACSAAYVFDSTMRTAVVNSLFGDGAAAIALSGDDVGNHEFAGVEGVHGPVDGPVDGPVGGPEGPQILSFASHIITDAVDAMRYDWDSAQGKFSFFLDPEIPYVVGAHAELVVGRLLAGTGLRRSDITHWLVHSGGKKVIDAVRVNLGLTRYDLRHTTDVLRDYGNLSSGSFLFSYQRLLREGLTKPGDYGVLMTMGPGSTIETALVQW